MTIPNAGDSIQLKLNQTDLGYYAGFPVTVEFTKALHPGRNHLEILAAYTMVWECKDGASTHLQLYPTGLLQPIIKKWRNIHYG